MSKENLQVVRSMFQTLGSGDWTAPFDQLDPAMQMDTTRAPLEGLSGLYSGREQVLGFWAEWLEAWGEQDIAEPELIDAGDQAFAWVDTHRLRGRGSGAEVDMPPYGWVITFRNGKAVSATMFVDRNEALEAAGLAQ
jgi:ketosteroid isomerase-like protein